MFDKIENETFGQYIARLRNAKGYSQRKLALVSGVSNTTISRIENGDTPNPDLGTLQALSAALGIDETVMLNAAGYLNESKSIGDSDLDKKDLRQIEKDLEKMMTSIHRDPNDGFSKFDGDTNLTEEDYEMLEDAFRTTLRIVRKLNKQTYTPNKYKNKDK